MEIDKRSNPYEQGKAHTKKRYHSILDNPHRGGTREWHAWRAGFTDAIEEFINEFKKQNKLE